MFEKENKIASILMWIGIIEIVASFIMGMFLGREDFGYYQEQVWSLTFIWWGAGFVSGMFFIGLSEVVEQLHRINLKMEKPSEFNELELEDDELELIDD